MTREIAAKNETRPNAVRFGAVIRRLRPKRGWTLLTFSRKAA